MILLILAAVAFASLFWVLRIFFDEYNAKWLTITAGFGLFIATLCMVVGLLLVALFGDGTYFRQLELSKPHLTDAYETFILGRALAWYLLYPYVAIAQFIVWYLQIFFLHFKFIFILTHGAGLYIMYVFCRFVFDQNVNLMNPDRRFGIRRDGDGNIIR